MVLIELLVIIALVLVNGILAMTELAVVSARKARLQVDIERGDRRAQTVLNLMESPSAFLATVQVGITLIGIIAGVFGGASLAEDLAGIFAHVPGFANYAEPAAFVIVVALITVVTLVFGELVPKRLALAHPELISKMVAPAMLKFGRVARPLVAVLEFCTDTLLRPLRLKGRASQEVSAADIRSLVEQGMEQGSISEGERQIINRAIKLGGLPVRTLMTPRNDVQFLKLSLPIAQNLRIALDSGRSILPLIADGVDQVVGVVALRDLTELVLSRETSQDALRRCAVSPLQVPESSSALALLDEFHKSQKNFALVVDEYGGVAGIATMHDILEAIVGEVSQSPDDARSVVHREDGSLLVDSDVRIDNLFEELEIPLPLDFGDRGYTTVSGFVMDSLGKVPTEGDSFVSQGYHFEVVDMDQHRIDKILILKDLSSTT